MSLRYQDLLGQARKNAPKARAKSAPAKSRFVDENDDAITTGRKIGVLNKDNGY